MMPSFPNLTLTVITDQGKSHCDRNTKIVPIVTNWDSVVMSVLSLLCLPTLRKNITIFPYHELHIKTRANYKVPLCVFTTSLTLFLPLCVTALCSHDSKDKEFSTDLQKCWFTGGQRSPTELKSVLVFRDWTFRWRTPQQGERCIEPSCIYLRSFINYLSFGSRCVLCLSAEQMRGTPVCFKASYKYTSPRLDLKDGLCKSTAEPMSADPWRSIVPGATGCHGNSILIIKSWQRLQQRKSKEKVERTTDTTQRMSEARVKRECVEDKINTDSHTKNQTQGNIFDNEVFCPNQPEELLTHFDIPYLWYLMCLDLWNVTIGFDDAGGGEHIINW